MAQLVAHLLCKQGVRGSSPRASTVRKVPARRNADRDFLLCREGSDSCRPRHTSVVQ